MEPLTIMPFDARNGNLIDSEDASEMLQDIMASIVSIDTPPEVKAQSFRRVGSTCCHTCENTTSQTNGFGGWAGVSDDKEAGKARRAVSFRYCDIKAQKEMQNKSATGGSSIC